MVMTNNCQSCTHSTTFCGKNNTYLICEHEDMDLIACHQVKWQCKHYEYEAGTDAKERE